MQGLVLGQQNAVTTHGQVSTDVEKDQSAHLRLSVC